MLSFRNFRELAAVARAGGYYLVVIRKAEAPTGRGRSRRQSGPLHRLAPRSATSSFEDSDAGEVAVAA
jgi:hypothetical protein